MPSGQSIGSGVDDSTSADEDDEGVMDSGASLPLSAGVEGAVDSLCRLAIRVESVGLNAVEVSPAKAGPLANSKETKDQSANNRPNIVS